MEGVQSWLMTVCCDALICGIVSVLAPGECSRRVLNAVLGMFMLCCFLLPAGINLSGITVDTDEAEERRQSAAEETDRYFYYRSLELSEQEINRIIYKELADYGLKSGEAEIYIYTDEAGDGRELIVELTLPERFKKDHTVIQRILEYEIGTTVLMEYS